MPQSVINEQVIVLVKNNIGETISYPMIVIGADSLYVTTKDLDLGSSAIEKYLDYIVLDFEAPQAVPLFYLTVGYRDRLEDDVTWLVPQEIDANNPIVSVRETARFFTLKFEDNLPIVQWQISKIEFWGRAAGGRLT